MTHLSFKEAYEGQRRLMEQRCFEEGHTWEHLDGFGDVCRWCQVVAAADDRAPAEEERAA